MARSLSAQRRGSVLIETALIVPLSALLILGVAQIALLMEIDWLMDQAAEAACRAALVAHNGHPDPEVAAQLTLAPVTGTSWLRGAPPLPSRGIAGIAGRYGAAILKTRAQAKTEGARVTATVTHAAELIIPLAGPLMSPVAGLIPRILTQKHDWVQDIALVTGRPHLKLEKSLSMDFGQGW